MKVLFLPDYSTANAYQRALTAGLEDQGIHEAAAHETPERESRGEDEDRGRDAHRGRVAGLTPRWTALYPAGARTPEEAMDPSHFTTDALVQSVFRDHYELDAEKLESLYSKSKRHQWKGHTSSTPSTRPP